MFGEIQTKYFYKWINSNCIIKGLIKNIPVQLKYSWATELRTLYTIIHLKRKKNKK